MPFPNQFQGFTNRWQLNEHVRLWRFRTIWFLIAIAVCANAAHNLTTHDLISPCYNVNTPKTYLEHDWIVAAAAAVFIIIITVISKTNHCTTSHNIFLSDSYVCSALDSSDPPRWFRDCGKVNAKKKFKRKRKLLNSNLNEPRNKSIHYACIESTKASIFIPWKKTLALSFFPSH